MRAWKIIAIAALAGVGASFLPVFDPDGPANYLHELHPPLERSEYGPEDEKALRADMKAHPERYGRTASDPGSLDRVEAINDLGAEVVTRQLHESVVETLTSCIRHLELSLKHVTAISVAVEIGRLKGVRDAEPIRAAIGDSGLWLTPEDLILTTKALDPLTLWAAVEFEAKWARDPARKTQELRDKLVGFGLTQNHIDRYVARLR